MALLSSEPTKEGSKSVSFLAALALAVALWLPLNVAAQNAGPPEIAGRNGKTAGESVLRILCGSEHRGTGFLHKSGLVVTAAHVVEDCVGRLMIQLQGSKPVTAVAKAVDPALDLALVALSVPFKASTLTLASEAALGQLDIGAQVATWGFPAGYPGSRPLLSVGYLSGATRWRTTGEASVPVFVVNAAFNGGNSGGPLLDTRNGNVIGVVSAKLAVVPPFIEQGLKALAAQKSGLFTYTAELSDGTKRVLTETQLVAEVLHYLRTQVQLVIGYAIRTTEVRAFLAANKVDP
jgi:hypothetical protein